MPTKPIYRGNHARIRRELIAAGQWIGQPCPWCSKPLWPGQRLALGHASDSRGYSIPGQYIGITHLACELSSGGRVNPWGRRTQAAEQIAARSPARVQEIKDAEARKTRKADRAEFEAAQAAIAADEAARDW